MTTLRTEAEVIRALAERVMGWGAVAGVDSNWNEDLELKLPTRGSKYWWPGCKGGGHSDSWSPQRDIADAMELMDRAFHVSGYSVTCAAFADPSERWQAVGRSNVHGEVRGLADTPQIAIIRAVLASIDCEYEPEKAT